MKYSRRYWRRYAAFAALVAGGSTAIDVPLHAWPQLGISLAASGITLLYSRRGMRAADARLWREDHRPDYAKIARLEIELGLVQPPKGPPPRPVYQTPLEEAGAVWLRNSNEVLREAQAAAAKWKQCPVCLRTHAGRCAG